MNKLGKVANAVKVLLTTLGKAEKDTKGAVTLTIPVLSTVTGLSEWFVKKAAWVAKENGKLVRWNRDGVVLLDAGREFLTKMGEDDASWGSLKGAEPFKSETPEGQAEMAEKRRLASEKRKGQPTATQLRLNAVEERMNSLDAKLDAILAAVSAKPSKAEKVASAKQGMEKGIAAVTA